MQVENLDQPGRVKNTDKDGLMLSESNVGVWSIGGMIQIQEDKYSHKNLVHFVLH